MNLENPRYQAISPIAERALIDSAQALDAVSRQAEEVRQYRGSMVWKKAKGREYLVRTNPGSSTGKSLGVRSQETESVYAKFQERREAAKQRFDALSDAAAEHARVVRSLGMARVPTESAAIIRALTRVRIPHTIVGTHALDAYETLGSIKFDPGLLATRDLDLLMDARRSLRVAVSGGGPSLLSVLQKTDPSYRRVNANRFRAESRSGFVVEVIVAPKGRIDISNPHLDLDSEDLQPVEIASLEWLASSPKCAMWAYDARGGPVRITAPDPRAFALHKAWVSQQENREPEKARRDIAQARAVVDVLADRLPAFQFKANQLRMFPAKVIERAAMELTGDVDFGLQSPFSG